MNNNLMQKINMSSNNLFDCDNSFHGEILEQTRQTPDWHVAATLLEQGNIDKAEELCRQGIAEFPRQPEWRKIYIDCAIRKKDEFARITRAQDFLENCPASADAYFRLAQAYLDSGNYDLARKVGVNGLERAPQNLDMLVLNARIDIEQKRHGDALAHLATVRKIFPAQKDGYVHAIALLLSLKRLDDAWAIANEQIARMPGEISGYASLADIARRKGDKAAEQSHWQAIRQRFPQSARGYLGLGRLALDKNDNNLAESLLADALKLEPDCAETLHLYAEAAMRRRDYGSALLRWAELRALFPQDARGYTRAIAACLQTNDLAGAEELAALGIAVIPDNVDILNLHIDCMLRKRDYGNALVGALRLREKFPKRGQSWRRLSDLYITLADYEKAEEVCRSGLEACPRASEVLAGYARLAMAQREYDVAADRWQVFREIYPNHFGGYSIGAICLLELGRFDEAEALCAIGKSRAPRNVDCWQWHAEVAMRRRDYAEGLKRWQETRSKFPHHPIGYVRGVHALLELGQREAAVALCQEGMGNCAGSVDSYLQYVDLALRVRNYDEAVKRCITIIEKFPYIHNGYTKAAYACMDCLKFDLADTLAQAALRNAPNAVESWLCHADLAVRRGDLSLALQRRKEIMQNFSRQPQGYLVSASSLMDRGEYAQAQEVLEKGMRLMPNNPDIWIRHAEVAMRQRDLAAAQKRWGDIRARFPGHMAGYCRGAYAFMDAGLFDDAEKLCEAAFRVNPYAIEPLNLKTDIVFRKRYCPNMVEACTEICEKFPRNPHAWLRLSTAHIIQKDFDAASLASKKAMGVAPFTSQCYAAWADLAFRQKNLEEAARRWQLLLARFPKETTGYVKLIEIRLAQQKVAEAEEIYAQACREFAAVKGGGVLLALYLAQMNILIRKDQPDAALDLAKSLWEGDPYYREQRGLITRIYECYIPLGNKIKRDKLEFVNNQHVLFLLAALLSHYAGMQEKLFFIVVEKWQCQFKIDDVRLAVQNAIEQYHLENTYAQIILYKTDSRQIIESITKLLESGYKYLFKLYNLICGHAKKSMLDVANEIADSARYVDYSGEALYQYIKFLHFFNPARAWHINDRIARLHDNNDLSTPYGLMKFRNESRRKLSAASLQHMLVKPAKLSIAICISGQLRGYHKCLSTLLNAFDFENHKYHIYVNVWQNIGRKFPGYSHAWRIFKGSFLSAYLNAIRGKDAEMLLQANYVNFNNLLTNAANIEKNTLAKFYDTNDVVLEDDDAPPFSYLMNFEKMYYKIQKANDMTKGKRHDLTIRTRPDYMFRRANKVELEKIYFESHRYGCVFAPHGYSAIPAVGEAYEITDAFAIGASGYMDIYSDTYNTFTGTALKRNDYKSCHTLWAHSALGYMLFSRGVDVRPLPLTASLVDVDPISIFDIYNALLKDIATRTPTDDDRMLLEACEKDIAEINAKKQKA